MFHSLSQIRFIFKHVVSSTTTSVPVVSNESDFVVTVVPVLFKQKINRKFCSLSIEFQKLAFVATQTVVIIHFGKSLL